MAFRTGRDVVRIRKLPAVNICMTVFAFRGRGSEIDIQQLGFEVRRLVTIDAGNGSVRSHQWERRLCMIELREFFPVFRRVARVAPERLAVWSEGIHSFLKLVAMRVLVALRAGQIIEVILGIRFGGRLQIS